jgi:hypothetical protein
VGGHNSTVPTKKNFNKNIRSLSEGAGLTGGGDPGIGFGTLDPPKGEAVMSDGGLHGENVLSTEAVFAVEVEVLRSGGIPGRGQGAPRRSLLPLVPTMLTALEAGRRRYQQA